MTFGNSPIMSPPLLLMNNNIMMPSKQQTIFTCEKCDAQFFAWQGRCTECGNWGTVAQKTQESESVSVRHNLLTADFSLISADEITTMDVPRFKIGIEELDNVLGGGIVHGSFILLSGDPGIGKSTLSLQLLHALNQENTLSQHHNQSRDNGTAVHPIQLYVCGEESPAQIKLRVDRLSLKNSSLKLLAETRLEKILAAVELFHPQIVIIDSIQTIVSEENQGEAGSVTQIKICATKIMETAKRTNIPLIVTGHVTKDGSIAGPKIFEHLVDVVLYLEGDPNTSLRVLRSPKNRFGNTQEIGVFEMTTEGLKQVKNPGMYFMDSSPLDIAGTCTTAAVQGNKIFFLEVQALVTKTHFGYPVRKTSGFDLNRLTLLCAVMSTRVKLPLNEYDVYLNVVGGLKLDEPAFDLAVCYAILSAMKNEKTLARSVVFGEVGLGGEVRPISHMERRIKEAKKMNFQNILTALPKKITGDQLTISIPHIQELLKHLSR